jgi:hypothetical protein
LQTEFQLVVEYVERESLLREVRAKATKGKPGWREWEKIALFLDRVFSRGQLISDEQNKVSNKVLDHSHSNEIEITLMSIPNQ